MILHLTCGRTYVGSFIGILSWRWWRWPLLQLFGLQANAALTAAAAESSAMQQLLMRVHQLQGASLNAGPNTFPASASGDITERASSIFSQLPPQFDLETALALRPHAYQNAMDTVLMQELARYNALIALMARTLQGLKVGLRHRRSQQSYLPCTLTQKICKRCSWKQD